MNIVGCGLLLVMATGVLGGCATIIKGGGQTVTVSTTPVAAACTLDRAGGRIGVIETTPGTIPIERSKNDLTVTCVKDGYQTATVTITPAFNGVTFGNLIAGGIIGFAVDASTGASYTMREDIRLDLAPAVAPVVAPGVTPIRLSPPTS